MKAWMTKALELLKASLVPPKHELNELDWKAALQPEAIAAAVDEFTRDLLLPRLLSGQVNLKTK
jgi:hypothetical protein